MEVFTTIYLTQLTKTIESSRSEKQPLTDLGQPKQDNSIFFTQCVYSTSLEVKTNVLSTIKGTQ